MLAAAVEPSRVVIVGAAQTLRQDRRAVRHGDQMHVVAHQAIAEQRNLLLLTVEAQRFDVMDAVQVGFEDSLAVIAPLRNVVRHAHRNHANQSSHGRSIL